MIESWWLPWASGKESSKKFRTKLWTFFPRIGLYPATTGSPKYYASFDVDNFIVGPTPDSNYTVELHYFYRPASITTDDSGTTWLSENASDALLYACLVEAYTFMKGEADMLALYTQRYGEAVSRLKVYGEGQENNDAYRDGLPRVRRQ